jgi:hypothetical protein
MSTSEILPALPDSPLPVPAVIACAGARASEHFLEFFAATIRNKNTRAAYVQVAAQFFRWCEQYDLKLGAIRPLHVAAYIESKPMTAPSIKQHLVALRGLFNWLVIKPARALRCFSTTAGRWKRPRTWRIIPTRGRPSSTTGARNWRT